MSRSLASARHTEASPSVNTDVLGGASVEPSTPCVRAEYATEICRKETKRVGGGGDLCSKREATNRGVLHLIHASSVQGGH